MKKILIIVSISVLFLIAFSTGVNADLLGQYSPGDYGSMYNDWKNQEETFTQDDTYSSCRNSEAEDYYNFEIDGDIAELSCPTIDGIKVYVDGYSPAGSIEYYKIKLSWDAGSSWTSIKNTGTIGTTDTDIYVTAGGSSDTWGHTWDKTEFYNENFLFYIEGYSSGVISGTLYTDHIYIEIYYTWEEPDTVDGAVIYNSPTNCSRAVVTWNKGDGADTTLVKYSTEGYPTFSTGTQLYNGTGQSVDFIYPSFNDDYYFVLWSWNDTYCRYSDDFDHFYRSPCNFNIYTINYNIINATGTFNTSYSSLNGWTFWVNYTGNETICDNTSLTLYENIINATGTHESLYNALTGWKVWANYTGNETGGGCEKQYFNYSDENLTINISYWGCNNTNTSSYGINEDNWFLINGFSLETGELGLLFVFVIFSLAFAIDREERKNIWKPILFFLDVPICFATGVFYLGNTVNSIQWWIGIFMFLFAVLLSFGGLYYSLAFGRK